MDPNLRAEKIYTFLNTEGRNRLILSQSFDDLGIELLDVGLVLSQALENKMQSSFIANIADEKLKSIFEANIKSSSKFGKYLGLQNLDIDNMEAADVNKVAEKLAEEHKVDFHEALDWCYDGRVGKDGKLLK